MYTEIFEKSTVKSNVKPIFRKRISIFPGDKFGSRTVIHVLHNRVNGHVMVECRCDCGKVDILQKSYLIHQGRPCVECGAKKPRVSGSDHHSYKHGHVVRSAKKPSEYNTWVAMRQRCSDKNDPQYKDYGGRGIFVCSEWNDYATFIEDMGARPAGFSLERVDNNGSYCKENCRWVDSITQNNNRRSNRIHEIDGIRIAHTNMLRELGYTRDKARHIEERKGIEVLYNAYRALKA